MHREQFRRELEREWEWIESEEKKLEEEKKKVVAEWVAVEEAQREYNRKRESFEKRVVERFDFLPADDVVTFNVGGQLYKSTVRVWTRDRFSILAQLCTTKPKLPKLCVDDDAYYFDRDAWIFQFIYTFLRDNALPDAIDVLRELYCEASFYRVGLLRHAIEAKLLGDDAVLASTAFPRTASSASVPATNADDKAVAASATKPDTSSTSKKTLEKKETTAAGDGGASKASHLKSNDDRFHELPDPFGFTSKKKGARVSWTEDQN